MKSGMEYLPQDGVFPFKGLNTLVPSTSGDTSFSPRLENVEIDQGTIVKRGGTWEMSTVGVSGTPKAIIDFTKLDGTKKLVLVTTTKEYVYNATTMEWDNITYQSGGVDVDRSDSSLPVNWCVATGTQGRWLIFTDGSAKPRYWDGVAAKFALLEAASGWSFTNFVTCRDLQMYANHLVMIGVTRSAYEPASVCWSTVNSLVDFTGTGSGEILATDVQGGFVRAVRLGDRLVLYSLGSIGILSYVGGDAIYSYETVVQGTGMLGTSAVADLGSFHLFLTPTSVWAYEGGREVTEVGLPIKGEIGTSYSADALAWGDKTRQEAWFQFTSTVGTSIYIAKVQGGGLGLTWTRFAVASEALLCVTTVDDVRNYLTLANFRAEPWARLAWFYHASGSKFVHYTTAFYNDNDRLVDTAITESYETMDLTLPVGFPSENARFLEIEFEAKGTAVSVAVSTDRGANFGTPTAVTLTTSWATYKAPIDAFGKTMRVKFSNATAGGWFHLRSFRVWYRDGGM